MIGCKGVWQLGQRVGEYELIANLRVGGMATLFMGRQAGAAGFSRVVAIKAVHPELASDDQFRQMLIDEAMLASRIHHPNVVHVETLGEHAGAPFLVMEYVHGCSLSQLQRALVARGRRLAPAFATRVAMTVADALHAAHETCDEQGRALHAVHRDVSPENILLSYTGHVKLIDFGIAKAYGRRHKTREGLIKGKFRYMAPEQAYAQSVDRRTDVYQLGVVLWELLTLRRLFDADDERELLAQVRDPRILAPSALVRGIPAALDAALLCALARDPNDRPADAQQFARMLARAMPDAQQVDSAALSGMALAMMHEQRTLERGTLPPQVYALLEREIVTAPLFTQASAQSQARFTVEHHEGDHAADAAPRPRQSVDTAPGYGPGSDAPTSPGIRSDRPRPPRMRRLVRMASELSTTLTRFAQGTPRQKLIWLGLGALIGLAGASALVVWAVGSSTHRPLPHRPPPPVPVVPVVSAPAPAIPLELATGVTSDLRAPLDPLSKPEDAKPTKPGTEGPGIRGRQAGAGERARDQPERDQQPAAQHRELAPPRIIDGTPLIPEPGF